MFIFAQKLAVTRANVYSGGETTYALVERPEWGVFTTKQAAIRWYTEGSNPDLKGLDDAWLARHFKTMKRNHGIRLVRKSRVELVAHPKAVTTKPLRTPRRATKKS